MNKIEQQIHDESYKDIIKEAKVIRINQAYSLLEKHSIGFAEWLGDKRFNRNTWFDETNHCMDMVTTQELFNEYIQTL